MNRRYLQWEIIVGIFLLLFLLNIFYGSYAFRDICLGYAVFGCLPVSGLVAVGTICMYFSLPLFTFLSTFILQWVFPEKKRTTFPLILVITWLLCTEILVRAFHISIIHTNPLEGDYYLLNSIYLDFNCAPVVLLFMSVIAILTGYAGKMVFFLFPKESPKK